MDIRNVRQLKTFAAQRLEHARDAKPIVLIYSGLVLGLSVLTSLVNFLFSLQISRFGGLSNLGTRTLLSSVQSMLPIAQTLVVMCLDLGYLAAMLRIARGQYASPQTLRLGFDRFWTLLRLNVIKGLIFFALGFACIYLSVMIYMMTPLSRPVMELLLPLVNDMSILSSGLVLDETVSAQLMSMMGPLFFLCSVVYCAVAAPIAYQYRMADYVVIDRPALGAVAALRESRKMMRGNRLALLRLDLGLWWYYGALLLASAVCYGDQLLPLLGVTLPLSADAAYYLFYLIYLALLFAAYYFLRSRAEVTYALAYDAIKPAEDQNGGTVLGSIFNKN